MQSISCLKGTGRWGMGILGLFQRLHLDLRELGREFDRATGGLSTCWQHPGMCSLSWACYMPANAWERSEKENWSGQHRKRLIWGYFQQKNLGKPGQMQWGLEEKWRKINLGFHWEWQAGWVWVSLEELYVHRNIWDFLTLKMTKIHNIHVLNCQIKNWAGGDGMLERICCWHMWCPQQPSKKWLESNCDNHLYMVFKNHSG